MVRPSGFNSPPTPDLPEAVIFDMDGTLCDVQSILHLVLGDPTNGYRKDFDAFYAATVDSPHTAG